MESFRKLKRFLVEVFEIILWETSDFSDEKIWNFILEKELVVFDFSSKKYLFKVWEPTFSEKVGLKRENLEERRGLVETSKKRKGPPAVFFPRK